MTEIGLTTFVRRKTAVVGAPLDDEIVLLDVDGGAYYGLDDIASHIWDELEQSRQVSELCEHLLQVFDVDRQTCERDVLALLNRLAELGLVEGDDAASA